MEDVNVADGTGKTTLTIRYVNSVPLPPVYGTRTGAATGRSGQWARLLGCGWHEDGVNSVPVFLVEFVDGRTDEWVIDDETAEYEFAPAARA